MLTRWLWHGLCRLLPTQNQHLRLIMCRPCSVQRIISSSSEFRRILLLKTKSKLCPWLCVQNLIIVLREERNYLGLRAWCSEKKNWLARGTGEYCIMRRFIWVNNFRLVKSRWVRWAGHVAHGRKNTNWWIIQIMGCSLFTCLHVEGKAVPLQAWSGPEGSRKLRFPDFVTTAQDGGEVVSLTHRPPLPPGNAPGTHVC